MTKVEKKITNKDLWTVYWRLYFLSTALNFERWEALGYWYAIDPILRKFYGDDKEKYKEAIISNLQFFNTEPNMARPIMGLHLSMIEAGADLEAQSRIKMALMGPFAGIGDSVIGGTVTYTLMGIAIPFALAGDWLLPLLIVITGHILVANVLVSWYGLKLSYSLGKPFIDTLLKGGIMRKFSDYASMIGLAVVGSMVPYWTANLRIGMPLVVGGIKISIQDLLNTILPAMLPLIVVLGAFWLVRRGTSYLKTMLYLFAIGFVLGCLGVLAV